MGRWGQGLPGASHSLENLSSEKQVLSLDFTRTLPALPPGNLRSGWDLSLCGSVNRLGGGAGSYTANEESLSPGRALSLKFFSVEMCTFFLGLPVKEDAREVSL